MGHIVKEAGLCQTGDLRFINNVFAPNTSLESYDIRKMIAISSLNSNPVGSKGEDRKNAVSRTYDRFAQNYIFYRLTDVMLMKAEALTQLAASDEDVQLRQAFNLVQAVANIDMALYASLQLQQRRLMNIFL